MGFSLGSRKGASTDRRGEDDINKECSNNPSKDTSDSKKSGVKTGVSRIGQKSERAVPGLNKSKGKRNRRKERKRKELKINSVKIIGVNCAGLMSR